ncbi:hypothetical protein [Lutibacter sp.]
MSKVLKYILSRTAFVIIVLHTFIPHPHSSKLTDEKHSEIHQKSNCLIGIIRLAFHENNDESLDNLIFTQFKNSTKFNNKHPNLYSSLIKEQYTIKEKHHEKNLKYTPFHSETIFLIKTNGLRGPPPHLYTQPKV